MKGGYFMVDCSGIDLTDATQQEKTGLFADMQKALKSGKPLIAYGMVWGDNSDAPLTPINFFAQQWTSTLIVGTASTKNITVNSDDEVYVTDLVSAGAAKSATTTTKSTTK